MKLLYIFVFAMLVPTISIAEAPPSVLFGWGSFGSGPGEFNEPDGIALDGMGNVYVADTNNNRIQKFTKSGAFMLTWGSYGSGAGQFSAPHDVATTADGFVFVCDTGNRRIQKFSASGGFVQDFGNAPGDPIQLTQPVAMAIGPDGLVYVLDSPRTVVQYTQDGAYVSHWVAYVNPTSNWTYYGIAVDNTLNVLLCTIVVRRFTSTGEYIGWFDTAENPLHMATDHSNNLFVACSQCCVVKHAPDGTEVYNLVPVVFPLGVAISDDGWIYVSHRGAWGHDDGGIIVFGNAATPTIQSTWGQLKAKYR